MSPRRLAAVVAAALPMTGLPAVAAAGESPGAVELTPYAAYRYGGTFEERDGDATIELDDHASVGLILDLRESANTQWEIIYARQDTSADLTDLALPDAATDVELQYVHGGGTYLGDGDRVRPYVAATIGGTRIAPSNPAYDSDTFWSFSIGAGLQLRPAERLGIRLEARAWGTLVDADTDLFCASGPDGALCAISIDGRMFWQLETFAGLVFRF